METRNPHQPPAPNNNRTIGERDAGKSMRANMDAKQSADRAKEKAVVEAHRSPGGPDVTVGPGGSTTPQGFKINVPG